MRERHDQHVAEQLHASRVTVVRPAILTIKVNHRDRGIPWVRRRLSNLPVTNEAIGTKSLAVCISGTHPDD